MIILAVWNSYFIPWNIAFEPEIGVGIDIINFSIDFLFFIDIIVNFRTTIITK